MNNLIKKIMAPVALASALFFSSSVVAQQISQPPKERQVLERIVKTNLLEPPEIEWERIFRENGHGRIYSVRETTDKGFILAGSRLDGNGGLIKIDSNGNKLWEKSFGGVNNDFFFSIQQTIDRGYIVAGGADDLSGTGDYDGWLIKTDSNGNLRWQKKFIKNSQSIIFSVRQTADNGFILAGGTGSYENGASNGWLIRTDSDGNKLWERNFGATKNDSFYSVRQTTEGGFIIAGETDGSGRGDCNGWLVKTDSNGNLRWQRKFVKNPSNSISSIENTTNGFVLAGGTGSYENGASNGWLIRIDSDGNKLWEKTFGGAGLNYFYSVGSTADNGFILGGETLSNGWLIKTDSDGNKLWEKSFKGTEINFFEINSSVQQTIDEGYIVAGRTSWAGNYFAYLAKLRPEQPPITPPIIPPEEPPIPTKNKLVFIIHGLNIIPGSGNWPKEMENSIREKVDSTWDVVSYDWTGESIIIEPFDSVYEISKKLALSQIVASELGKKVGKDYSSKNLEQVQLIGNSCGAWLINGVASEIRKSNPNTRIQLTFLDAYALPFIYNQLGNLTGNTKTNFWSDNYYTFDLIPFTQWNFKNSFNVNISGIVDPDTHASPRIWYQNTITSEPLGSRNYGFVRSMVHGDETWNNNITNFPPGKYAISLKRNSQGTEPLSKRIIKTSEQGIINSVTGGITLEKLASQSKTLSATNTLQSVWIDSELFLPPTSNYLNFNYQFEGQNQGYFSVYFNNSLISFPHQNIHGTELENSKDIYIGDLKANRNFLGIRFTPFSESTTSTAKVFVGDLEFGMINEIRTEAERWKSYE